MAKVHDIKKARKRGELRRTRQRVRNHEAIRSVTRPRVNDQGHLLLFVVDGGESQHAMAIPPLPGHRWEIWSGNPVCVLNNDGETG